MTTLSRPARAVVASLVTIVLVSAAACGGDDGKKKSSATPTTPTTPVPTTGVTPKPTPTAVDPLTGTAASANGVVGVKIDDTGNGRPQRNIDAANVVYIEEVEGGLTRLLAVFNTSLPTVESVRSTRPADPEILAQYGPIAFAASGGARNPLMLLDQSPLKATINDRGGPGFKRESNRSAPYNLSANLASIAKTKKAPRAKNVGFTWSASTAGLAGATAGTRIRTVVGGTPVEFRYDTKTKRYERYIDGNLQHTAAGKVISTPNVIVQFCKVTTYTKDRDVNGNPNAYTHSVGSGKIAVFRNGKQVTGTWSRATATAPTTFHDATGKPIPLNPGGVWVVLTRNGAPLN